MIFSLSILILNSFLLHADPPHAQAAERTQADQQIDDECAPLMNAGVAIYNSCVADKGREAEAERQRRAAEARRLMEINETPSTPADTAQVCNPSGAVRACMNASETAARINASLGTSTLNASAKEAEISSALQACRAACNADSAQVLRNFLGDCRDQDHRQTRQAMLYTMNNCGVGTTAANPTGPSTETAFDILASENMSMSAKFNALSLRAGYTFSPLGGSTNSFASTADIDVGNGIRYQQTTSRDGSVVYQYCKGSRCYSSYDAASEATSSTFPSGAGGAAVARGGNASGFDPIGGDATGRYGGFEAPTPNAEFSESATDATGLEVSLRPPGRPENLGETEPAEVARGTAPGIGREAQDTATQTAPVDANNDQQVVTPVQSNEPVPYQPGNFAGLQSAMSAPSAGAGMASSSSMGGGEVSNGGSSGGGSYSGSSTGPVSRPLAFAGSGQISPSALRGADSPGAPVAGGARPSMDVAAPGGGSRGGGFGDFGGGGRMMASSRPSGPASLESSMNTVMRSDSYYRTAGGRGGAAVARAGATRRAAPCKGPNCPRKTRAGIAAANCDGNPQCLLALTGKLQGPRRQAAEAVWETDSSGIRRIRSTGGERGIASVQRSTEPGGVVRGKIQDVLNHLGSSEVFKVDHDGMLEVDL